MANCVNCGTEAEVDAAGKCVGCVSAEAPSEPTTPEESKEGETPVEGETTTDAPAPDAPAPVAPVEGEEEGKPGEGVV